MNVKPSQDESGKDNSIQVFLEYMAPIVGMQNVETCGTRESMQKTVKRIANHMFKICQTSGEEIPRGLSSSDFNSRAEFMYKQIFLDLTKKKDKEEGGHTFNYKREEIDLGDSRITDEAIWQKFSQITKQSLENA